MEIIFDSLKVSSQQIENYLLKQGFKIEEHETPGGATIINGKRSSWDTKKQYAIPQNETFDINLHDTVQNTFREIITSKFEYFKKNLLN